MIYVILIIDKGENISQAAENVRSVYGPDIVGINHAKCRFHRFRSGNFYVKDVPRSGIPMFRLHKS